ncbi:lateral signaling target protein 2 homolog [Musca vetustissima]|uniref:lateral signaling target protein 2 homolog n=1 Tax=Musca vetustissima TaxID=27455 RepID=UPI002AB74004|nr:lateral signaling target protein 2 homolog [Musca vetustissima]
MDTILKWLNKPKADDKSLLARFFHADRALAAVASELDSFDGRAEPDRCSRLVSRLRQGQDKVLAITNLIIEELLGDERDQRAFRAKFPEEVLQENLAGQLWFGAECLAAGSSIMNREQESKEMRPLAEAVTRSLNNVRYLLRDQCLRNNVPNSERLNLDKNDAATEQLYESLKRFDRLFAEFEWRYVSAMVQVKSKEEYEMQELICVLCSETLQRALKLGLLEQEQVDAFDPALMFSIPRLAIVAGLVIYPDGPLNMDMPAEELSEMFRPFRSLLIKVREYLRNLNETELFYLERLLCTNEEISLKETLKAKQTTLVDNNNDANSSSKYCGVANSERVDKEETTSLQHNNTTSKSQQQQQQTSCKTFKTKKQHSTNTCRRADSPSPAPSTSSSSEDCSPYTTPISSTPSSPRSTHSMASTTTAEETNSGTTSPDSWNDDDEEIGLHEDIEVEEDDNEDGGDADDDDDDDIDAHYADDDDSDLNCDDDDEDHGDPDHIYDLNNVVEQIINLEIASADCATGYLISNTTLGNLLQPQEVPLTDNFVVSDSDLPNQDDYNDNQDVEMPTTSAKAFSSSTQQTERQEQHYVDIEQANQDNNNSVVAANNTSLSLQDSEISLSLQSSLNPSNSSATQQLRPRRYSDLSSTNNGRKHHTSTATTTTSASSSSSHCRRHHHTHHQRRPHRHGGDKHEPNGGTLQCAECSTNNTNNKPNDDVTITNSKAANSLGLDIETPSSSSSMLDDNKTVVRSGGRMKFKNTENLLHRLFVSIAGVADQLQTNFAFDLRQILRSVFLINMSPAQEELDIPEKPKENELFEFRASENDVIQESAGSSQSIYSAEEVNPEGDNQSQNSNSSGGSSSGNNSSSSSSGGGSSNDNNRVYRHSTGSTAVPPSQLSTAIVANAALQRQQIERSRSLDNQEIQPTTHQNQSTVPPPPPTHSNQNHQLYRNRHHSTSSTTTPSSSENNSPICERSTTTATNGGGIRRVSESNANSTPPPPQSSRPVHLSPPAWIPDQKAPRCMSCNTPFTAFRRRHHCRNCGGVFCGVCSNTSAPLPKYGLTKAVRVCRACYVHELGPNSNGNPQNQLPQNQHHHHQQHQPHHHTLVSQTTSNNEPSRLRRPVTTTRAFD